MKKLLIALAFLFSFTAILSQDLPPDIEKQPVEQIAELPSVDFAPEIQHFPSTQPDYIFTPLTRFDPEKVPWQPVTHDELNTIKISPLNASWGESHSTRPRPVEPLVYDLNQHSVQGGTPAFIVLSSFGGA